MLIAWPSQRLRTTVIALIGVIALVGSARQARAEGCHAVDRPVLGLTFSWDEPSATLDPAGPTAPKTPAVTPLPCSGDAPGAVSTVAASALDLPVPTAAILPTPPSAGRWPIAPPLPLDARDRAESLDRPPRTLPA